MVQMPEYELTILEKHLDTFGHVNNATYLELYEEARWDVITKNGYGLEEIQRTRKGPVILEINIKFMRELRLRERIRIRSKVDTYESRAGVIHQEMVKEDGSIASQAKFIFGLFDLDRRRLIAPTKEWLRALGLGDAPQPPLSS